MKRSRETTNLHLSKTWTLTSLSWSWRLEFQSDPLDLTTIFEVTTKIQSNNINQQKSNQTTIEATTIFEVTTVQSNNKWIIKNRTQQLIITTTKQQNAMNQVSTTKKQIELNNEATKNCGTEFNRQRSNNIQLIQVQKN